MTFVLFIISIYGFHIHNMRVKTLVSLDAVIRNKWIKQGVISSTDIENIRNDDDEYSENPTGFNLYPGDFQLKSVHNKFNNLDEVDFESLKVDDPIFLDMDWPVEAGAPATAFAKHMAWRRQLADVERKHINTQY